MKHRMKSEEELGYELFLFNIGIGILSSLTLTGIFLWALCQ